VERAHPDRPRRPGGRSERRWPPITASGVAPRGAWRAGAGERALERAGLAYAAGPERRGTTHFKNENCFPFSFLKTSHKKCNLDHFPNLFKKKSKNKSCSIFRALQLCLKDQSQILARF
jgi:hypothetical protein